MPRIAGAVLLLGSVLVAFYGLRIGLAQWMVFAPDVPGGSPAGDVDVVARAARLAPRDGTLSLWVARQAHREMLTGLLSPDAENLSARAVAAARAAIRDRPFDSYAHVHLARVLLDVAAHPRTSDQDRTRAIGVARGELSRALDLYPTSSDIAYRVGSVMLSHWTLLGPAAHPTLVRALRRVGDLDRLRFPDLLALLSERLAGDRNPPEAWFAMLRSATPDRTNALGTLAGFLRTLAAAPPEWAPDNWTARAGAAAVGAAFDAARTSGYSAGAVVPWLQYSEAFSPDRLSELAEQTRRLAIEDQDNPGVWFARAWAARAAGELAEARQSAATARRLARAALIHELADSLERVDAPDAALLDAAERFIRGMRGAERASQAVRIEAVDDDREALARTVRLLNDLNDPARETR